MIGKTSDKMDLLLRHRTWTEMVTLAGAFSAAFLAALALVGWLFPLPSPYVPSSLAMAITPLVGWGILSAAAALILKLSSPRPEWRARLADFLASGCVLLGVLTLLDSATRGGLGLRSDALPPTSAFSSLNLIMMGLALLWLDWETPQGRRPAQYLAILALIAPGQTLLGFCYGISTFHFDPVGFLTQMAVVTASAWFLLAIGTLFARPSVGVMAVFTSSTMAGRIVRRLLVPSLLVPSLLGWFIARQDQIPISRTQAGASFLALSSLIIFVFLLWKNGIELYGVQAERDRAELELKRATREAEEANRTKSAFLANMSHEIRSPVGVMMGFAELMADPACPPEERQKYAQVMRRNGQALLTIIDDILDLSKVEAGKLKIQKVNVNLLALVNDVTWVHETIAKEKGIDFSVRWIGDVPEMIVSDPIRLRQILTNLIGNAIKFTAFGSVRLTLETRNDPREPQQAQLCFEVSDTGPGIRPENVQKLFQPFVQGDPSVTRQHGGSGLGLALSQRLARALGGNLVLKESAPGKGSVFLFSLRTVLPDNVVWRSTLPQTAKTPTSGPEPQRRLHGLRVLLVDDAPDNRMLLKWIMDHEGAQVEIATNGREAVDKALAGEHDVVLMDIQMPVMDGLTAAGHLRRKGYRRPILALTAHAMKEDRERSLQSGLNDHISKPVQKETLIEILSRYLPAPDAAHG